MDSHPRHFGDRILVRDHRGATGIALLAKLVAEYEYGVSHRPEQRLPYTPTQRIHRAGGCLHSDAAGLDRFPYTRRVDHHGDAIPHAARDIHRFPRADNRFLRDLYSGDREQPDQHLCIHSFHPFFHTKAEPYQDKSSANSNNLRANRQSILNFICIYIYTNYHADCYVDEYANNDDHRYADSHAHCHVYLFRAARNRHNS